MPIRFDTQQKETKEKVLAFIDEWNALSSVIVVRTSGSTGAPKKIVLQKKHMIASALATCEFLGLKKGDTALLCLSMNTIGGRMMVVRSLILELNLIVVDVSSTPLESLNEKVDFAAMVPMQVQKSIEKLASSFASITKLIIGGGPISFELIDQIQELPTSVYHTFGMTETISHIAMRKVNHPIEFEFNCLPGIILSEKDGSMIIDAPKLGVQQLATNDSIELLSPTSFRWIGRTDFVVNSGGIKLHPEEIESKLAQIIQFPFFVFGEPDDLLGERLILAIEHTTQLKLTKVDFQAILSNYSLPKEIRYIPAFKYTKSGKIERLTTQSRTYVALEIL